MNTEVISHLEGDGNYTWVCYASGHKHLIAQTIKVLEPAFPGFIRIHKRFVVNPAFITQVLVFPENLAGAVLLRSGTELPISRRRWSVFGRQLKQLFNAPF
ncbi:LytR/AlgR family response regulator transcription factor [Tellurirhabdus bombi]|uniref:LytR/AlgR family response regulator transcription factor n=1 Tax=Tellurirhabdus bombi TaxID=2907205 RepID=UPI001F18A1AB|nr:LytTR family DNA-binding domain-containing protein [Tellurirhabdus bombi]